MASPHVAGTAALLLEEYTNWTLNQIKVELTSRATPGVLSNIGSGSPNLLLFTLNDDGPLPTCKLQKEACTLNTDCCSGRCRGKAGKQVCK
jgi:hypothetical protein